MQQQQEDLQVVRVKRRRNATVAEQLILQEAGSSEDSKRRRTEASVNGALSSANLARHLSEGLNLDGAQAPSGAPADSQAPAAPARRRRYVRVDTLDPERQKSIAPQDLSQMVERWKEAAQKARHGVQPSSHPDPPAAHASGPQITPATQLQPGHVTEQGPGHVNQQGTGHVTLQPVEYLPVRGKRPLSCLLRTEQGTDAAADTGSNPQCGAGGAGAAEHSGWRVIDICARCDGDPAPELKRQRAAAGAAGPAAAPHTQGAAQQAPQQQQQQRQGRHRQTKESTQSNQGPSAQQAQHTQEQGQQSERQRQYEDTVAQLGCAEDVGKLLTSVFFPMLHEFMEGSAAETSAPTGSTQPTVAATPAAAAAPAAEPARTYKLPSRRAKPIAAQPPQPPVPAQDRHTATTTSAAAKAEPSQAAQGADPDMAMSDESDMVYDLYMPVDDNGTEGVCGEGGVGVDGEGGGYADYVPPHVPVIEVGGSDDDEEWWAYNGGRSGGRGLLGGSGSDRDAYEEDSNAESHYANTYPDEDTDPDDDMSGFDEEYSDVYDSSDNEDHPYTRTRTYNTARPRHARGHGRHGRGATATYDEDADYGVGTYGVGVGGGTYVSGGDEETEEERAMDPITRSRRAAQAFLEAALAAHAKPGTAAAAAAQGAASGRAAM